MRLTISNMVCLGGIDERMNIDISQARFLAVYLSPPSDGVTVYDSRRLARFLLIGCWCVFASVRPHPHQFGIITHSPLHMHWFVYVVLIEDSSYRLHTYCVRPSSDAASSVNNHTTSRIINSILSTSAIYRTPLEDMSIWDIMRSAI